MVWEKAICHPPSFLQFMLEEEQEGWMYKGQGKSDWSFTQHTVIGESVEVSQLLHWEVTELDATGSVKGLIM